MYAGLPLAIRWALALVPHVTTIANYDTLKMSGGNKGNDVLALFTPCAHFIVSILGTMNASAPRGMPGVDTSVASIVDKACNLRAYQNGSGILTIVKRYFDAIGYNANPTPTPLVFIARRGSDPYNVITR